MTKANGKQNLINFTKENLERLPFTRQQYDVGDSRQPGLRLRVNPGKSKTFILYRKIAGRPVRIKLGRFPDLTIDQARRMASSFNGQIAEGRNPQTEKKQVRAELTFKGLFELYYQQHALRNNRKAKENGRVVEMYILPGWGNLKVSTITKEQARKLHTSIADRLAKTDAERTHKQRNRKGKGKTKPHAQAQQTSSGQSQRGHATANKAIKLARAVYNFGIREGYYSGLNPCAEVKKYREESRDRFLSQDELQRFLTALQYEQPQHRDFLRLALFTGARKANLLSIRWRIPSEQAKNGEVNIVALSRSVLAVLKWRRRQSERVAGQTGTAPSPFVFTGTGKAGHMSNPRDAFMRVKEKAGISDLRLHDLRRTLASYMAIGGTSLHVIGKALNHKNLNTTTIYARLSHDPVLQAVEAATKRMTWAG